MTNAVNYELLSGGSCALQTCPNSQNRCLRRDRHIDPEFLNETLKSTLRTIDSPLLALSELGEGETTSLLFYVNQHGSLHRKTVREFWGDWERPEVIEHVPVELPIGKFGQLGGCITTCGAVVFFENITGTLQGIKFSAKEPELLDPIASKREEATPFVVLRLSDEAVALFYWHRDKRLHRLTVDLEGNTESDQALPGTDFTTPRDFMIRQVELDNWTAYFIVENAPRRTLIEVNSDGVRREASESDWDWQGQNIPVSWTVESLPLQKGQGNK